MKKKLLVLFAVMLFLSNPASARTFYTFLSEGENDVKDWKPITSTDSSVNVFYKIENSELVFKFMNLNHDKKVKIWYQFRCEGKIGYDEQIFTFTSFVIVNEGSIEYVRWDATGRRGPVRITLFEILSVEFLQED